MRYKHQVSKLATHWTTNIEHLHTTSRLYMQELFHLDIHGWTTWRRYCHLKWLRSMGYLNDIEASNSNPKAKTRGLVGDMDIRTNHHPTGSRQ